MQAAFVAPPGWVLLASDYSAVELRLMAHFSGDARLLDALTPAAPSQAAADPFVALAAQWRRVPAAQVTPQMRRQAKQIAYALLYGMGQQALAGKLGVSDEEARSLRADFTAAYQGVVAWTERVRAVCRERGHLTTLSGRRRYLPMLRSADRDLRAHAERRAINGSVQGSAADVVKGVMLEVDARLRASGMEPHCRLLLQLHDELLFEVRAEQLAPAAAIIHGVMEGAAAAWRLRVALPVRLSVGRSWGELQHVGADES